LIADKEETSYLFPGGAMMKKAVKKTLILLFALGLVALFSSLAAADKSVVAIVKAAPQEAEMLDGKFHIRDLPAISHTPEYADSEGDHTRATWDLESEEVWYRLIKQATDLAGGIPVEKGDTVLIKPNFVVAYFTMKDQKYGDDISIQGAFTDPRACLAVARICKEMGAGRIIIGESPARGDAWSTFMCYGLLHNQKRYAEMGIPYELMDLCENWEMMPGVGLGLKQYPICRTLREVQCLVNIGAFKTHAFAGVTIALKNLGIGLPSTRVIGANKFGLPHNKLAEVVVDVNHIAQRLVPKQMHISDAVYSGTWGPAAPYFYAGLILAGQDPVAVDAVGTACMNHNPRNIGTTRLAAQHGLGRMEYEEIEVVGTPLEEAIIQDYPRHPFKARCFPWAPDSYGKVTNWDQYYRHPLYGVPNYPRW
jgi:uncharacterized protein (DUF362 family)